MKTLRDLREEKKLTQTDVARQVGIKQGYYSKIETQKNTPSVEVIKKIAKVLGEEVILILMGSENSIKEVVSTDKSLD